MEVLLITLFCAIYLSELCTNYVLVSLMSLGGLFLVNDVHLITY